VHSHGGVGYGLITARRRLVYFEQANDTRQALPKLFVLVWLGGVFHYDLLLHTDVTSIPAERTRGTRSQPVGH